MPSPPVAPRRTTSQAARAAARAAEQAGAAVSTLGDAPGAHRAARLFAEIWATTRDASPISAHAIRALAHTGSYVAGAWAGDELVGASVGFLALHDGSLSLHSHITGVALQAQGANLGFALKQHQRAWALERGITEISWTFDPLIRGNARFNLMKLGAVAVAYHPDFYGPMQDGINAGDHSDRCAVRWELEADEVVAASERRWVDPGEIEVTGPGAGVLLAQAGDGGPELVDEYAPGGNGPWLCRVPADVVRLRATDPPRARAWRHALRDTMGVVMADGLVAGTVTRDGWYVLTRPHDQDDKVTR